MNPADRSFLSRAFTYAYRGCGYVSPNPMVGCIIVKEGRIISTGFHHRFGGDHAEVDAIKRCRESLEGSTLYVSLEPCSHFGKTPPCADLIIQKKIKRVVVGFEDPNPLVAGRGVARLREAGIEVEVISKDSHSRFYRKFTKYITTPYPFVTIKSAQTLDGKIAETDGKSKWITNEKSRQLVQHLRTRNDAILTTSKTVTTDDARLNVRDKKKFSPLRAMLSSHLFFNNDLFFFRNEDKKSMIIVPEGAVAPRDVRAQLDWFQIQIKYVKPDSKGRPDLDESLRMLHEMGITSVLVEAGAGLTTEFINRGLFDEMVLFIAPKIIGPGRNLFEGLEYFGLDSPMQLKVNSVRNFSGDTAIFLGRV